MSRENRAVEKKDLIVTNQLARVLTKPVASYDKNLGQSIIHGAVYRGRNQVVPVAASRAPPASRSCGNSTPARSARNTNLVVSATHLQLRGGRYRGPAW